MKGLLLGHRFRVRVRWRWGEITEGIVRVRGLTMQRAWMKILERPTHPEVEIRAVGPVDWPPLWHRVTQVLSPAAQR